MMRTMTGQCTLGDPARSIASVIFGVDAIVDGAQASAAAWKSVFDPFLRTYAAVRETRFVPFDVRADYARYMQGRPRLEGARDFLASRDIVLPYDHLRGLAMSQEEFFLSEVRRHGIRSFSSTIALVLELRRRGVRTAAVSVHRDGSEMLRRAGAAGMFDVVMDGLDAPGVELPEHPDTHLYLRVAQRLNTPPGRTAVVEESAVGVAAARDGGFGAVVGVDRTGGSAALGERGANPVIADLSELRLHGTGAV
jgi:beta-phosphoglucomutase-like phosphatase (HAD superfamily)